MPHVTMLAARMISVAASTIQPPHLTCGMKSRISTRNARREKMRVGIVMRKRPIMYLVECAGACRWAETARKKHTRVSSAAMGWTMRTYETECRVFSAILKPSLVGAISSVV
jgi:hypothetical protein